MAGEGKPVRLRKWKSGLITICITYEIGQFGSTLKLFFSPFLKALWEKAFIKCFDYGSCIECFPCFTYILHRFIPHSCE